MGHDAAALLAKAVLSAHDSLPPLHQPTPVALQGITYDQFTEKEINSFICPSYLGKDEVKKKKETETLFTDVHDVLLPARSREQ